MRRLRLSVMVPNYNHARLLPRALDSLFAQSRPPDEVVVADDASTDDSVEVVRSYQSRFPQLRLICYPQNAGVIGNWIRCLNALTGDLQYGLSADDYVLPGFFEQAVGALERHPSAGLCCCQLTMVNPAGDVIEKRVLESPPGFYPPGQLVKVLAASKFSIIATNSVIRRELLYEPQLIAPDTRWCFDWIFTTALALRYGACYLDEPFQRFEVSPQSYSVRGHGGPESLQVLRCLLDHLALPEFDDVRGRIRASGLLTVFGARMLNLVLRHPRYWRYLSWPLLRNTFPNLLRMHVGEAFPQLHSLYRSLR